MTRTSLLHALVIALAAASTPACGSSDGGTAQDCDKMAADIRQVAAQDQKLEEMGRQTNPCADPVAITTTDYRAACAELKQCLCRAGQTTSC